MPPLNRIAKRASKFAEKWTKPFVEFLTKELVVDRLTKAATEAARKLREVALLHKYDRSNRPVFPIFDELEPLHPNPDLYNLEDLVFNQRAFLDELKNLRVGWIIDPTFLTLHDVDKMMKIINMKKIRRLAMTPRIDALKEELTKLYSLLNGPITEQERLRISYEIEKLQRSILEFDYQTDVRKDYTTLMNDMVNKGEAANRVTTYITPILNDTGLEQLDTSDPKLVLDFITLLITEGNILGIKPTEHDIYDPSYVIELHRRRFYNPYINYDTFNLDKLFDIMSGYPIVDPYETLP